MSTIQSRALARRNTTQTSNSKSNNKYLRSNHRLLKKNVVKANNYPQNNSISANNYPQNNSISVNNYPQNNSISANNTMSNIDVTNFTINSETVVEPTTKTNTPKSFKNEINNHYSANIYCILLLNDNSKNYDELINDLYLQNKTNFVLNIVNNNCGKYCSHKIELLQQKYSKNQNIIFTKSVEDITKIINDNIIKFLLNGSFTYFTWLNTDYKYSKNILKKLEYNNNYFSYSNSIVNIKNNKSELYKYSSIEDVTTDFQGCDAFMWHKEAIKKIGILQSDISDHMDDYFKRTFMTNFNECLFVNSIIVENKNKTFKIDNTPNNSNHNIEINNNHLDYVLNDEVADEVADEVESHKKSPLVSVIVPCIDHNKYVTICIEHLIKNASMQLELLIVVKDDTIKSSIQQTINTFMNNKISALVPISFIIENVNSYSEAVNLGIKQSVSEYVILINNNIVVDKNWDHNLYNSILASNAIGIIPITNYSKNNYNNFININYESTKDFFEKTNSVVNSLNPLIECFQFDMFCIILNKQELNKIGGIDNNYINLYENEDLYESIKLFNREVFITPKCIVYNYEIPKHISQDIIGFNNYLFENKWNKSVKSNKQNIPQITSDIYNMEVYKPQSELKTYIDTLNLIKFSSKMLDTYNDLKNGFDVDSKLYKYLNYEKNEHITNIYSDMQKNAITSGLIYNKQQLINFLEVDNIHIKNDIFYCLISNNIYVELKLITKSIYQKSFEELISDISVKENTIVSSNKNNSVDNSLVVTFIGDYKIGLFIINKLINSDKSKLPCVFVFNNLSVYNKLKKILSFFEKRIVIKTKEFGNDIIPTLQSVYYCLNTLKLNTKYIYKLHTKSNEVWFEALTNILLDTPEADLTKTLDTFINTKKSNCVGEESSYVHVKNEDKFCKQLLQKYAQFSDKEYFIAGTIFFTKAELFVNVINFVKDNNYHSYFMNNMYESNNINVANSPIHYLERLFGIIKNTT